MGLVVDTQSMNLGTMNVRRNNRSLVEKGGWSLFSSTFASVDLLGPAVDVLMVSITTIPLRRRTVSRAGSSFQH